MNQDAVEDRRQCSISPNFHLEIKDKHSMARETVGLLSGSDVDPLQSNNAVKPAKWRRQVSADSVDPTPVHPTVTPSHRHLRKYDWLSKINALKNRIPTPSFTSLDVFSLSKKESGDVDLVYSKESQKERRDDGVDPSPITTQKVTTRSDQEGNRFIPGLRTESRDVDGCEDDGVPVPTRKRISGSDHSLGVDSVFYDYEGSHCVDDINKLSVVESNSVDAGRCRCAEFSSVELSDCVDPQEGYCDPAECFKRADKLAENFINEYFSNSANVLSSSIDAPAGQQISRDWQPHEAETILSDIYQDLGEACICLVEDGCICSLEECQCPDQDDTRTKTQGIEPSPKATEGTPPKASSPEQNTVSQKKYRATQPEGTSTDLYFHSSGFYSGSDQVLNKISKRRKNSKLSERVACKRRISTKHYETEVDPKKCDLEDATVAIHGTHNSDEHESVDPPPRNKNHLSDTFLQTKVSPDIFYSENYSSSTGADELTNTEISIGDPQLLIDCIAAADDSISKAQRAQVDDFEKTQCAEAQFPIKSQTEISEDGFSCHTEIKSTSTHGTLTKTDFLAFKTDVSQHAEDENANKYTSDISQTSCNMCFSNDSLSTETYNKLSAQNKATDETNDTCDKENKNVTLAPKPSSSPIRSTAEISISLMRKNDSQLPATETAMKDTSTNDGEAPALDASSKMPASRVCASKIPKPLFKKTLEKNTGEQIVASEETSSISQIKSTQSRSSNFSITTTQAKESVIKGSSRSCTKAPHTSNSRCTEEIDTPLIDKEQKLSNTTTDSDQAKPYAPQMITFFKHKDAKLVTTIPPASPRSRKIVKRPKPELPEWNCSTAVEKPRKEKTRPPRLVSKRSSSHQSTARASSASSKQSLSSALTTDSVDRLTSSALCVNTDMARIRNISPRRSRSHKMDERGSLSAKKQPFLPAGKYRATQNDRKKVIPATNTARSHPDLRIHKERSSVEIPVVYPSSTTKSSASMLVKIGTKRAQEKDLGNDCKKANVIPHKTSLYTHAFLGSTLNANSSNSAAGDAEEALLPVLDFWSIPRMFLLSTKHRPKYQNNDEANNNNNRRRPANIPRRNIPGQAPIPGQRENARGLKSKLPVPCWECKTRKLGCLRSAKGPKMRSLTTQVQDQMALLLTTVSKSAHQFQPKRVSCATKVPVIDFAMALEELYNSQTLARTAYQQRKMKREQIFGTTQHAHSTYPWSKSAGVSQETVLLKCGFLDQLDLVGCCQSHKIKND